MEYTENIEGVPGGKVNIDLSSWDILYIKWKSPCDSCIEVICRDHSFS